MLTLAGALQQPKRQQPQWALLQPHQTQGQTPRYSVSLARTPRTIRTGQKSGRGVITTSISRLGPFRHDARSNLGRHGANSVVLSKAA